MAAYPQELHDNRLYQYTDQKPKKLLDRVREKIHLKNYSNITEQD